VRVSGLEFFLNRVNMSSWKGEISQVAVREREDKVACLSTPKKYYTQLSYGRLQATAKFKAQKRAGQGCSLAKGCAMNSLLVDRLNLPKGREWRDQVHHFP
jgi:hypothetical protein